MTEEQIELKFQEILTRIGTIAKIMGESGDEYEERLFVVLMDMQDVCIAEKRLREPLPLVSMEELEQELRLNDEETL